MGRAVALTVSLTAAVATGYAASQSLASAGALTLNGSLVSGGVGTPDAPRRVVVHSAGNDSARTITVVGTARSQQGGGVLTETMAGANAGDATTTQDFATVTSVSMGGASAGAMTAGTSAIGSTAWVPMDLNVRNAFQLAIQAVVVSGTPTYQIDVTYDDVFAISGTAFPLATPWPALIGSTVTADTVITTPIRAARITLTVVGSVKGTFSQVGD